MRKLLRLAAGPETSGFSNRAGLAIKGGFNWVALMAQKRSLSALAIASLIISGACAFANGDCEKQQCLLPGETFRDCADCPEMVVLPSGRFTMGSPDAELERGRDESPAHDVTVKGNIAIGKFEITHDEFAAFVADTKRDMKPCFFDAVFPRTGRHPAICFAWKDAQAYVAWLTQKTGHYYRLPSEGEWEFAARAAKEPGVYPRFYFGDDEKQICANANTSVKYCDDGFANTAPVGSFPANAFGLHDTIGNVWEFIEECPTENYDGAPADGSIRSGGDCSKRVIRGAGWINYQVHHLRTSNRGWFGPEMYDVMTGLRVVCILDR